MVRRIDFRCSRGALGGAGRAGARRGEHRRHHRPAEQPAQRRRRLAGRHLHRRLPECSPDTPGQFYTQAAGHPGCRLHPVHRQERRRPARPRSASSKTSGSTCRSASASTPRRPPSASWRPSPPASAPRRRRSGPAPSPSRCSASPRRRSPASPWSRSTTWCPPTANRPPSASASPARTSSSNPTSHGTATTTRASRSRSPPRRWATILKNRLVFNGKAGNGTFLTNPSTCHNPAQAQFAHTYSTYLRADSVEAPNGSFPNGSAFFEGALPPGVKPTGCPGVPFKPGDRGRPGNRPHRLARRRREVDRDRPLRARRRRSPTRT